MHFQQLLEDLIDHSLSLGADPTQLLASLTEATDHLRAAIDAAADEHDNTDSPPADVVRLRPTTR